jgi:HlyD family secretion protein
MLYLTIGVLAVLSLAAVSYLGNQVEVETLPVQYGEIVQTVEDTGYVQSATSYDLQATQNAKVVQVPVKIGQSINKGQTLVVLENLDLVLQIEEVQSRLTQTKASANGVQAAFERTRLELEESQKNLERIEQLYAAGIATLVEFDKARLQVDTYSQSLKEQQSQIDNLWAQTEGFERSIQQLRTKEKQLVINSPVNGVVLRLPAEPEQVLYPGNLLVSVGDPKQLELKAEILSDDMGVIIVGQKVNITAPVLGNRVLAGEVKKIYPQAEEKQSALGVIQRRVPVIISLNDIDLLKPGYEVRVAIETLRQDKVLTVNREAVRTIANNQKEVLLVVDGKIQHRIVETGIFDRNHIEILKGLEAGNLIVKDGSLELKENAKVKVL